MLKIIVCILSILVAGFSGVAEAQVSIGTADKPHPSAMLDMTSPTGNRLGVLFPLIPLNNSTDRSVISSPADFLIIFSPYANGAPLPGLNYWYGNKWNHFLNQTELYDSISAKHVAQIVLFVEQITEETVFHSSRNPDGTAPYIFPLDNVVYDSQNGYNKTSKEYIIPDNGIYEITCNVVIIPQTTGSGDYSMQTFVGVDGNSVTNDLVSFSAVTRVNGSATYTAVLNKGQRVYGAVGAGNWDTYKYRVVSSSLTIVKY
ncbi:MAG: hypothetical protein LBK65_01020 [Tannerellaceae bacterium]|jgi:hypothetical protein|nr:hypothetical protein [Tannerellaceae bacterium]